MQDRYSHDARSQEDGTPYVVEFARSPFRLCVGFIGGKPDADALVYVNNRYHYQNSAEQNRPHEAEKKYQSVAFLREHTEYRSRPGVFVACFYLIQKKNKVYPIVQTGDREREYVNTKMHREWINKMLHKTCEQTSPDLTKGPATFLSPQRKHQGRSGSRRRRQCARLPAVARVVCA